MIPLVLHQWLKNEKQKLKLEKVLKRRISNKKNCEFFFFLFFLVLPSNNEIDVELSLTIREFIEKVYNAYLIYLKVSCFL